MCFSPVLMRSLVGILSWINCGQHERGEPLHRKPSQVSLPRAFWCLLPEQTKGRNKNIRRIIVHPQPHLVAAGLGKPGHLACNAGSLGLIGSAGHL